MFIDLKVLPRQMYLLEKITWCTLRPTMMVLPGIVAVRRDKNRDIFFFVSDIQTHCRWTIFKVTTWGCEYIWSIKKLACWQASYLFNISSCTITSYNNSFSFLHFRLQIKKLILLVISVILFTIIMNLNACYMMMEHAK